MIRWYKIKSLVLRDSVALRKVKWRPIEIFYFPITTILIWGLFAIYSRQMAAEAGMITLIINIFWAFGHISQTTSNILMMEDIWSGSFRQVLLTGITKFEYLLARLLTATVTAIIVVLILSLMALPFGLNLFQPLTLVLIGITLLGSLSLAVLIATLILCLGREYGFLVFSVLQLFIMLSAPFFPKEIFPKVILYISYAMPFTAVFEAARSLAMTGSFDPSLLLWGFVVVLGYFIIGWPLYHLAFNRARRSGMLARMF